MADIVCLWKNQWKNDLTKPILNCVTSVHPRVLVDLGKDEGYYATVNRFLGRLRAEHED